MEKAQQEIHGEERRRASPIGPIFIPVVGENGKERRDGESAGDQIHSCGSFFFGI
jgi:hypothetical protein